MRTGLIMDLEPVGTGSEIFIQNEFSKSAKTAGLLETGACILTIHASEANIQLCSLKP
jgi:hypothetical protein